MVIGHYLMISIVTRLYKLTVPHVHITTTVRTPGQGRLEFQVRINYTSLLYAYWLNVHLVLVFDISRSL